MKGDFISQADIEHLQEIVGEERVSQGTSQRELHSHDESFHLPRLPEVVIWPHSTEEVSKIIKWVHKKEVPITPWGAGTSLEGNPIPASGGMVMDLQEMNRILEIREEDLQVDVQAGVVYKELNKTLGNYGLFFPPDPGAAATIGGMVANNASGVRTVKYGATKDFVLKLVVVLPAGEVITIGSHSAKSSSGYDLCRLFTGSEGTLGVITEVTLRLVGLPERFMAVRTTFNTTHDATATVFQVMSSGLSPAAMEFLDEKVIEAINHYKSMELEEKPTLFMEFHGFSEAGLQEEMGFVEDICQGNRCSSFASGIGLDERNTLWEARYDAFEAVKRTATGLSPLIIDASVPISRYTALVEFAKEATEKLRAYIFGHAGNGNIHVVIMGDPQDQKEWSQIEEANEVIVLKALEFEGTCTGEHGVGIGKRRFMPLEHGNSLAVMLKIKEALDPKGTMNPGKVFP
ncbi:MAG: FAD-binding oxidoreductase [Deltaproteobacteria bacterium]|nr:MAG: FAD-binding oxidoreductase [Deltaproteobacteria bacterium]